MAPKVGFIKAFYKKRLEDAYIRGFDLEKLDMDPEKFLKNLHELAKEKRQAIPFGRFVITPGVGARWELDRPGFYTIYDFELNRKTKEVVRSENGEVKIQKSLKINPNLISLIT